MAATGQQLAWIRKPWPWFAIALAATAFGFWPSFFSDLGSVRTVILVHGIAVTFWMALTAAEVVPPLTLRTLMEDLNIPYDSAEVELGVFPLITEFAELPDDGIPRPVVPASIAPGNSGLTAP